jgi:transglutaminase-like putative cysteine protease
MARTLSIIDVCKMVEARGGCDLTLAPYRVPDTLSPEMRVRILTAMARAGADSPEVCAAADRAIERYLPSSFSPDEADEEALANALLAYVQNDVGYKDDPQGEWYQGPIYTLTNGGDCEDLSALFASMCNCIGVQSRVVWIDQPGAKLNHVSAQVLIPERGWQYAETTIASAKVGEHPYAAAKKHGIAFRKTAAHRLGFR